MSTVAAPVPTLSTSSMETLSGISTSGYLKNLETNVREFWSTFPCPPPWKPRLLIEVNASRLDPDVSRSVQTFLAGKCDMRHLLSGSANDYSLEPDDLHPGFVLRPTETPDPGSSVGDPATSNHQWCDSTCQLSFGSAILLVVVVLMVAAIVCITRHKVRHKMAATRPSRQQLQLSASTSDAVNCTEFSNLEVCSLARRAGLEISMSKFHKQIQADDDIIYPPFRHRGLPHPPTTCHPSCDPKRNCPNCSSCHPLMRVSPPDLYYSRAYSAVYETVDDEDEDVFQCTENENGKQPRDLTPVLLDSRDLNPNCFPWQDSQTSISTVQLRPHPYNDPTENRRTAETGFNGEDRFGNPSNSRLPKYFELERNYALSGHNESVPYDPNFLSSFGVSSFSGECYNSAFAVSANSFLTSAGFQRGMLPNPSKHSCDFNHAHRNSLPSSADFQKICQTAGTSAPKQSKEQYNGELQAGSLQCRFHDNTHVDHFQVNGNSTYEDRRQNPELNSNNLNPPSSSGNVSTTTSTFLRDVPSPYFCPSCHQDGPVSRLVPHRGLPTPDQLVRSSPFQVIPGPDLLKEASNHARRMDLDLAPSNDITDDNNEVLLRKPVLALHSQYFAKTPLS